MERSVLTLRFFGEGGAESDGGAPAETGKTAGTQAKPEAAGQEDAKPETASAQKDAAEEPEQPETETPAETAGPEAPSPEEVLRKAALSARFQAAQATARRWEQEAEAVKEIYPGFSLEKALREDKGFSALLRAGVPVRLAFEAANLEKIVGAAMRYAAEAAGRRTIQSIRAGTRRVRENPALDRAASVTKKDVGSLTEREILKILRQVGNGEKVTF